MLDYVLAGSINGIADNIYEIQQFINGENKLTDSAKKDYIYTQIQKSAQFITLYNYSFYVAQKNNIDTANCDIQIRITRKYLPKFSERLNENPVVNEEILFQSDRQKLRKI